MTTHSIPRTGEGWQVLVPVAIIIAATLLGILLSDRPYYQHLIILFVFFSMISSAWNLIGGMAGIMAFGHATFLGIGAYVPTLLQINTGMSPWIGMFAGAILSALLALAIGYPSFNRLRGGYFALATVAVASFIEILVKDTESIGPIRIGGAQGIVVAPLGHSPLMYQFESKLAYLIIIASLCIATILTATYIVRSRLGYHLAAVRNDEEAAQGIGVNVFSTKMTIFAISAFITSLGGTFYAQYLQYVDPARVFNMQITIEMLVPAIVGGRGVVPGPVVGALLLVPVGELIRVWLGGQYSGVHLALYGAVLILTVKYMPMGIWGFSARMLGRAKWSRTLLATKGSDDAA